MTGIPKREFLEFFFENMKNNSDELFHWRKRIFFHSKELDNAYSIELEKGSQEAFQPSEECFYSIPKSVRIHLRRMVARFIMLLFLVHLLSRGFYRATTFLQ
jgi:hypothetical protein